MDLGLRAEFLCQRACSFSVDKHPHMLANAILLVDKSEPDAGISLVKRTQRFFDRASGNLDGCKTTGIGAQLLRYEDCNAQSRGTASIE